MWRGAGKEKEAHHRADAQEQLRAHHQPRGLDGYQQQRRTSAMSEKKVVHVVEWLVDAAPTLLSIHTDPELAKEAVKAYLNDAPYFGGDLRDYRIRPLVLNWTPLDEV
jgi:hypothetical protein